MKSSLIFSFFYICCILASLHAKWTSEQGKVCHSTESCSSVDTENSYSLYEELWENSFNIVTDTLQTEFLQRMQDGSLPAEDYLKFIVQDLYYLRSVTAMLQKIIMKEGMPQDLRLFFTRQFKSYEQYTNTLFDKYALEHQAVIHPEPAIASYLDTYYTVMHVYEPIYFAVALLPCARLWAYLGQQLNIEPNTAYYSFKTENEAYDPSKYFKPLLDEYQSKIDEKQANSIFQEQMENEKHFFQSSYQRCLTVSG